MIGIEIDGKDVFNIEFDVDLLSVAEAIQQDIEDNLMRGRSYDGSAVAALKPKYAERKRKQLGHAKVFDGYRTGSNKLINSVAVRRINDFHYEVYIRGENSQIMGYLQEGRRPLAGPRRAFGLGQSGFRRIKKSLDGIIEIKQV